MNLDLKLSNEEKLIESLVGFKGKILLGIPEETSNYMDEKMTSEEKSKRKINNALILAIMEAGSPVKNIPSRKLLEPVIMKHRDRIEQVFDKVYQMLIEGNETGVDEELKKLSLAIEGWLKSYFREDNGWEPNSPATQRAKNRRAGKPLDSPTTPLIDTGSLRGALRSIYVKK